MYVMNKKWDSIINIAQCSTVYIGPEHEVKAVPTGGGAVYRLGQYETAEIALAVLNDLYIHIATGCTYQMPNDKRAQVLARGMSDERPDKFAGFCWCLVVAMNQEEGIGASRLEKACNKMEAFQARYKGAVFFGSRKTATDAMKADLEGICDFEVRLPKLKAPRNRKEEQLYMAECDGAEIAWLVMASTVHLTFGFGEKRLSRLKQEAMKNYEQYLGLEQPEAVR